MKLCSVLFLLFFYITCSSQQLYDEFFTGERLRYDYIIRGNRDHSEINSRTFFREPVWAGPRINLIDTFRYGELFVEIIDSLSNTILYSRGYSSLFKEWQLTEEAHAVSRSFTESLVVPFPGKSIYIKIYERDSLSEFKLLHQEVFNPFISATGINSHDNSRNLKNLKISGNVDKKVDLVIVSEGYTSQQKKKFFRDAEKFFQEFLNWGPYGEYADFFNFYALFVPSHESGSDNPCDSLWRNTALNSHFCTFGSDRYLTVPDMALLRSMVSDVPYDQLCILVNTSKYGGGGILNAFTVFVSDNEFSGFLFIHEFGHAFAGLGDEYFTSPTAFDEMYNTEIEPHQPNITTNISFSLKWKDMVADSVPIPTPNDMKYWGVVGMFEGAAYRSKGIYRPYLDCAMNSKKCGEFCPVCRRAITKMILYTCDE